MRTNWLTTISAAVCAAGVAAGSADANPAGMAFPGHASPAPRAMAVQSSSNRDLPSAHISPFRDPLKYLRATVAEMPIGSRPQRMPGNMVMPPAEQDNAVASRLASSGPNSPQQVIETAQACERQGDVPQARHHYQRALSMWPREVEVLRAAARMEDRQGQLGLAESLYRQAVAANPQHAGALNDLGLCLARQGKLAASIEMIEQAVQLQPEKPLYRNNAATVLVEMRQDQKALAHLAAVHGAAEANYNLGQLLVQRGRPDEAGAYFVAALDQSPQMEAAHAALERLNGSTVDESTETASAPAETGNVPEVARQPAPPAIPNSAPSSEPGFGPQFGYPSTARSPEPGTSSHVPPQSHRFPGPYVPSADPRVGAYPRYLPPVGTPQGMWRR